MQVGPPIAHLMTNAAFMSSGRNSHRMLGQECNALLMEAYQLLSCLFLSFGLLVGRLAKVCMGLTPAA